MRRLIMVLGVAACWLLASGVSAASNIEPPQCGPDCPIIVIGQ